MSDNTYIHDDFGNRIPMLDSYGNLSVEVIMLYTEDKLTAADRKAVDDHAASDEMSKDALEGFALTNNSSKTRHQLGQVNAGIQKISGAKAISTLAPTKNEFDYRKLAAAVALLIVVAGGTYFGSQYFVDEELADNSINSKQHQEAPTEAKNLKPVPVLSDSVPSGLLEAETITQPTDAFADDKEEQPEKVSAKMVSGSEEIKDADLAVVEETVEAEMEELVIETVSNDLASGEGAIAAETNQLDDLPSAATNSGLFKNEDQESNKKVLEEAELKQLEEEMRESENMALEADNSYERRASAVRAQKQAEAEMMARSENRLAELQQETEALKRKEVASQDSRPDISQIHETAANFPGGNAELAKFINSNKQYNNAMIEQNLNGAVVVSFQIDKDGSVFKAKVESGHTGLLAEDAIRVIESMPKWEPAKRENGNPMKSTKTVTIKYGE